MKVVYMGPSPARWIPQVGATVERRVPVEVPVPLGLALVEQRDWAIFVDVREDEPAKPTRARARTRTRQKRES